MSTTTPHRQHSLDNNANKFVLVEWDDGSMQHTQWYLGKITDYNANKIPSKFRDLGIEAYSSERFSFFSHLMHHYMILQDGDTISGKAIQKENQEELFVFRIDEHNALHILHKDGREFDLERNKLFISGPISKDCGRLIAGSGCIEKDECYKTSRKKKHAIETLNDTHAPQRKRRRIARSSKERDIEAAAVKDSKSQTSLTQKEEEDEDIVEEDDDDDSKTKSRSPSTASVSTSIASKSESVKLKEKAPKVRRSRAKNRKIKSKDIEATHLANKLIAEFREKQLIPVDLPAINQDVYQMGIINLGNIKRRMCEKRKKCKKKNWIYETKYQSPFSIKMQGKLSFCSNFAFDTLDRKQTLNAYCRLLATGDLILENRTASGNMRVINFYGILIDRNVSIQINHEYNDKHWMSIHWNNGSRFMFGDAESIKISEWHRNISKGQYALYPDHEFIDNESQLWNIGHPLKQIMMGDIWTIHIPDFILQKRMIIVGIKNPKIYPFEGEDAACKACNMIWLELISMDAFLSCTKNVILLNKMLSEQRDTIYHKNVNDLKDVYSLECSPQFLFKYGSKCEIEGKLWPDTELMKMVKSDESFSNYLVLNKALMLSTNTNMEELQHTDIDEKYEKEEHSKVEVKNINNVVLNTTNYDDTHYSKWIEKLQELKWRELTEVSRNLGLRVAGNTNTLKRRIADWVRKIQKKEKVDIARIRSKYGDNYNIELQHAHKHEDNMNEMQDGQENKGPYYRIKSVLKDIGFIQKLNNLKIGSLILIKKLNDEAIFIEGVILEMKINGNRASIDCNVIITNLAQTFIKKSKCKIVNNRLQFELNVNKWNIDIFNNVLTEYYNENVANNLSCYHVGMAQNANYYNVNNIYNECVFHLDYNYNKNNRCCARSTNQYQYYSQSLPLTAKQKTLYKSIYETFDNYSFCKIMIPNTVFIQ